MNRILEGIGCVPGICYTCFYNIQKGVLSQHTPHEHKIINMEASAKMLAKLYGDGDSYYKDINKISFKYEGLCVIIFRIVSSLYLVVMHESLTDTSLLDVTVSECLKKIRAHIIAHEKKHDNKGRGASEDHFLNIEKIIKSDEISNALLSMEKMLNKIMGPIAAIVFNDSLNSWIDTCKKQNAFSIDSLADLLFAEINDHEKIDAYRNLIDPLLKPIRESSI